MIRQLDHRRWYFDCDPWEEPHFTTEAAALADEAKVAGEYEDEPRPVRHCAAPCWFAECDRCKCPAGDDNPITAYLVSRGVYDEYRVLAVFTEPAGAQEFVDHHNLTGGRYSADDQARVEEVDLHAPGWRRPPTDVLDGDVIDRVEGRLDPPLTLVRDEAATICPLPLDTWTADTDGHPVAIYSCAQSRAQPRIEGSS